MIPSRRRVLRWGFKLGLAAAYLADRDHGHERRQAMIENLDRFLGRTRAAPAVRWLAALNDGHLSDGDERPAEASEGASRVTSPDGAPASAAREEMRSAGNAPANASRRGGATGDAPDDRDRS